MKIAPSLKSLDSKSKTKPTPTVKKVDTPVVKLATKKEPIMTKSDKAPTIPNTSSVKWNIIGGGGCGTNTIARFIAKNAELSDLCSIMDTSTSNIQRSNIHDKVSFTHISGLVGSGKFRSENVTAISNEVARYSKDNEFADLTLCMFSLSGGSGSVICPLLIKEILRDGKVVVVVGVADTGSNIDTRNAINTLKTLENIAAEANAYLPLVLFSNTHGRSTVDNGVDTILANITEVLSADTQEMDIRNKLYFFQPNRIMPSISPGVKLLNVSTDGTGTWDESLGLVINDSNLEKLDSVLVISNSHDTSVSVPTHVLYKGVCDIKENKALSLGYPVPEEFYNSINDIIHDYMTTEENIPTAVKLEHEQDVTVTKSGLVL